MIKVIIEWLDLSLIKSSRFWDADRNRKWAIFTFNLPSHNYIHIAKYLFSIRDELYKTMGDNAVLAHIEDITCPRVDMNFIFEWSTRYLTSERSERVRYRVDHEKIKFISISGHVMFCLLYKHQWNTKPFYFNIFNGLKVERVVTKHGRSTWTKTKFIW